MSFIIIIRGPLGVGKTTIAKRIAKVLNGAYFSIDSVMKENNLDTVQGNCIPLENFLKGDDLIIPEIKKSLNNGKIVVIDGCFYYEEQIEHLLLGKQHIITLKASLQECIKRDSLRENPLGEEATTAVYGLVKDYGILIETEGRSVNAVINSIILQIQTSLK